MDDKTIEKAIMATLHERAVGKTACPSEVARQVAGKSNWRALMPEVRKVADRLAGNGSLVVTQRGVVVSAMQAVGPIRLAKPVRRR